jgi:phosphoglycerate dehydrogenase-like enzyme
MSEEKINVVVAMNFSDAIMERIQAVSPRFRVAQHFPDVPPNVWASTQILYTARNFPQPEEAPLLRWIQLNSAGMEHALKQRIVQAEDMLVTSVSGMHVQQIANFCMMAILAFHYKLPKFYELQRQHKWPERSGEIFRPVDMKQKTVGIVGYGSIGREVARLAQSFGLRVLASKRNAKNPEQSETDYSPEGTGDPDGSIPERIYPGEAIATMAAECDYLVLALPLTDKNRHLINERVLEAMKPSAYLINIARGAVVDEKALITVLSQKKIAGAFLDVFEEEPLPNSSPLWDMENVIISPHITGNIEDYHEKAADVFIANLKRYLEKKPLYNQLNREAGY